MRLYMRDQVYWSTQVKVWARYAKRRKLDCEPDLRGVQPADAVAGFIVYLRGHLHRDLEDRAKPGCKVWGDYTCMTSHRDLIEDMVESLADAIAFRRRQRSENGEEEGLEDPEVTIERLREEYNIPQRRVWPDLWECNQESVSGPESESRRPLKRQREDAEEQNNNADISPKPLESKSPPESANIRSPHQKNHKRQKQQSPNPQQEPAA